MIEITNDTIGLWRVQCEASIDWVGAATRQSDGSVVIEYRFRYYVDDKSFDSVDKKNWWRVVKKPGASDDEVIEAVRSLVRHLQKAGARDAWEALSHGDPMNILKAIEQDPRHWARREARATQS